MEVAFALVVVVLAGAMLVTFLKLREANARLAGASTETQSFEGRLEELRRELGAAREDAARKQRALEEARAEAKKKARREGKKMQREDEIAAESADGNGASREEVTRLKQTIAALEAQVASLTRDLGERVDAASAEARGDLEGQLAKAREELAKAREETAAVQQTLDELRESVRRKAEERPDVPGTALDLKALPTDAVQELARYFRKAEEFERLYGVAQGRLQLAQERAQDLQRRYYAVCRELALLTGAGEPASDEEARQAAEAVVDKSDTASASAGPSAQAPAAGQAAAAGEEAPKKKKRRRRRRKKKPGEGAALAEGAEGADEGEGEDGDDDEGEGEDEAVSAAASPAGQAESASEAAEKPASEAAADPAAEAAAEPSSEPASEPSSDEPRPSSDA